MKLLILNGPNLNLLGQREPGIYGTGTMESCLEDLRSRYPDEEGVALNAGAYTHTSIALGDCIRSLHFPVIELHISNVHRREAFRHQSMISAACHGVICGFGLDSYRLALEALHGIAKG